MNAMVYPKRPGCDLSIHSIDSHHVASLSSTSQTKSLDLLSNTLLLILLLTLDLLGLALALILTRSSALPSLPLLLTDLFLLLDSSKLLRGTLLGTRSLGGGGVFLLGSFLWG